MAPVQNISISTLNNVAVTACVSGRRPGLAQTSAQSRAIPTMAPGALTPYLGTECTIYGVEQSPQQSQRLEGVTLVGAIGAVLAASLCCVLPFVLVSIGIAGPWLAGLQGFEPYRIPFDALSLAALGTAWGVHFFRVRSCRAGDGCALPQRLRRTRIGLMVATVFIGMLIAAPYAIAYFGGSGT